MATFQKIGYATPFGRNVFLRSTQGIGVISRTLAASTVPAQVIDGWANQKIVQPGTVLATITSGPDAGKVGPFQAAGTDEIQVITPSGTWSGGTYTLTLLNATTAAIAYNATPAAVQTAVRAAVAALTATDAATLLNKTIGDSLLVTGSALSAGALTITYDGEVGVDVATATINVGSVTGTTPTAAVTTSTVGVAGATDGRGVLANIVGICNTFLPYQTMDRDVEVAVIYDCVAVQASCIELNAAGIAIALTDTTAAQLVAKKNLDITFVI